MREPRFAAVLAARPLAVMLLVACSGCVAEDGTAPAAGHWAPLEQGTKASPMTRLDPLTGFSVWLAPTDLTTGLDGDRLQASIGLRSNGAHLSVKVATALGEQASLVHWPSRKLVSTSLELLSKGLPIAKPEEEDLQRVEVRLVPDTPLSQGWYALMTRDNALVSRFHVGSCPVFIGIGSCEGYAGVGLVFSEPVSKAADARVLSNDHAKECSRDTDRFESRHQHDLVRHYFRCPFDPIEEGARISLGAVRARTGRSLALPGSLRAGTHSLLEIRSGDYQAVGKCRLARPPLSTDLPQCL